MNAHGATLTCKLVSILIQNFGAQHHGIGNVQGAGVLAQGLRFSRSFVLPPLPGCHPPTVLLGYLGHHGQRPAAAAGGPPGGLPLLPHLYVDLSGCPTTCALDHKVDNICHTPDTPHSSYGHSHYQAVMAEVLSSGTKLERKREIGKTVIHRFPAARRSHTSQTQLPGLVRCEHNIPRGALPRPGCCTGGIPWGGRQRCPPSPLLQKTTRHIWTPSQP